MLLVNDILLGLCDLPSSFDFKQPSHYSPEKYVLKGGYKRMLELHNTLTGSSKKKKERKSGIVL